MGGIVDPADVDSRRVKIIAPDDFDGAMLPRNPQGRVDGVERVFRRTPRTEAPAEMNTCLPPFEAT